jgi:glycosyltransferase involved in cell wall biosynthesis
MKILILINGWVTRIAGGDYHILSVSKYWRRKHDVEYLLPISGYEYSKEFLEDAKVHIYKTPLENIKKTPLLIPFLYLIRCLWLIFWKGKKYDIIVSSSYFFCDVIPAILFKLRYGGKLVVYAHGPFFIRQGKFYHKFLTYHNILIFSLLRFYVDLVFVVYTEMERILTRLGINKRKIFLTSNGIHLSAIPAQKFRKEYTACFIGRLVEGKGVLELPEIWYNVCKWRKNSNLVIVGDGPRKSLLTKLIKEKKLDRSIKLTGNVPDSVKYSYLKKSLLFLFPSHRESWPIPILEAMALGLPVIAYDLPEYKEIYGQKIVTVKPFDIQAFSQAVVQILQNKKLYKRYSSFQKWARKYDWKKIADVQVKRLEMLLIR